MVGRGLAAHIAPALRALTNEIKQRELERARGIESMTAGAQTLAQAAKMVTMLV